jgi:tRNA U34 5-methylaminomethyl-2-thiouridine-forming methyltransferase MnmC
MTITQADHIETKVTPNTPNTLDGVQTTITRDGSPTLLDFSRDACGTGESMHSSHGALSESLHVYAPALELHLHHLHHLHHLNNAAAASASGASVSVCIVGLGLGYLEMITAALLLRYVKQSGYPLFKNIHICSFESNTQLVHGITNWLSGMDSLLHEQICASVAQAIPDVTSEEIKSLLRDLQHAGQWTILGRLDGGFTKQQRTKLGIAAYDVIFYDAYSPASSPELWQSDFLESFLAIHASNKGAVFASYASRTSLKQSLRQQGFILEPRRGFGSKRECTLAHRPRSFNLLEQ